MNAWKALVERVREIERTLASADTARSLPERRVLDVRRLRVGTDGYDRMTDAQKIVAERMLANAIVEERAAGEVARDRELKRLAVVLDELRSELPEMASAARFELLDHVREMRA